MIAAIVGLLSLLLALVLGTLIGSAFSFYSTQKSEMETFASRALQLDLALRAMDEMSLRWTRRRQPSINSRRRLKGMRAPWSRPAFSFPCNWPVPSPGRWR